MIQTGRTVHDLSFVLLDAEITQLALSTLAFVGSIVSIVVGGYLLTVIKSARSRAIQDVAQIGLNLSTECDARREQIATVVKQLQGAIDTEGSVRREKDDSLGRDIVKIEKRMAYDRGAAKLPYLEGD
jgi:hypothetical protein